LNEQDAAAGHGEGFRIWDFGFDGPYCIASRLDLRDGGRVLHPAGAVGVVVKAPNDLEHAYRVRFPDGVEVALKHAEIVMLAQYTKGEIGDSSVAGTRCNLFELIIYRCVIGSQALNIRSRRLDPRDGTPQLRRDNFQFSRCGNWATNWARQRASMGGNEPVAARREKT
jgi:hypothetical protein